MAEFIEDNNLLHTFQSVSRKDHGTQTAPIKITDDIRENMGNRKLTISKWQYRFA